MRRFDPLISTDRSRVVGGEGGRGRKKILRKYGKEHGWNVGYWLKETGKRSIRRKETRNRKMQEERDWKEANTIKN